MKDFYPRWQESIRRRKRFLRKGFRIIGHCSGILFVLTAGVNAVNAIVRQPVYERDYVMVFGAIAFFCLIVVEDLIFKNWEP